MSIFTIVNPMRLTAHDKSELMRFSVEIKDRNNGLSIIAMIASNRDVLSLADFDWIKTRYRAWLVFNHAN